jgi:hypothetical protein
VAIVVFLVAFGTYAWTASPVASWLDSAEFVAASAQLGVSHSPGHPIPTLLGRAATLVPIGDISLRVNLATSLEGAIAVTLLYVVGEHFLAQLVPKLHMRARHVISAAAALGFALSWACWYQSVRAEVYALQAALLFLALGWVLHYQARGDRRAIVAAGLAVGLALANHHFIAILWFVPVAAIVLARRPGVRTAALTALTGVLGLAAFLYLPLRAARGPEVNWGDPQTIDRFAWTVSAKAFQKSLAKEAHESRAGEGAKVLGAIVEQASPAVVLAALAGAYLMARRRETRRAAALLGGIAIVVAAGPAMIGFDPDNPDAYGYLLPALGAIALLAAAGVAIVAEQIARERQVVMVALCALAAIVPPAQAMAHGGRASLRKGHTPDTFAHEVMDPLPPNALLVTSYYETAFQTWALHAVEGARPDVALIDRGFLTYPGFAAAARRRMPDLAKILDPDAPLAANRPAPLDALHEVSRARPIVFELAPNMEPALEEHLLPDGRAAWFLDPPPSADIRAKIEPRDREAAHELEAALADAPPGERAGATRVILWHTYLEARFYCDHGRSDAARAALDDLLRIDPEDPLAKDLAASCRP